MLNGQIKSIVTLDLETNSDGDTCVKSCCVELPDCTKNDKINSQLIVESMLHGLSTAVGNAIKKGHIPYEETNVAIENMYIQLEERKNGH